MIRLENISLKFGDKEIFKDFSLEINKGEKIAVKGPSGSGKSSMLDMFMGFRIPEKGSVFINSSKLEKSSVKQLRKYICWLPQNVNIIGSGLVESVINNPFLFSANKILLPDKKTIEQNFELLNLDKTILNNTIESVSGGEKQRIGIILCKLLQRPVLLLDEPTSALDKESVKKVLDYLMGNTELTILSASHEDLWLERCDRVIELK